jgi:hypothetical protein
MPVFRDQYGVRVADTSKPAEVDARFDAYDHILRQLIVAALGNPGSLMIAEAETVSCTMQSLVV